MSSSRIRRRFDVASHRGRGLSLLELVTIMAIFALLASLMLPSLSRAREQGKQSVCLARLKGIATASHVYKADDPNGWGIPVHPGQYTQDTSDPTYIGAYEWGGKSGIGRPDFADAPGWPHLGSKYGTFAGFGPATRPLNEMLYEGGFKDNTVPDLDRAGADSDTKLDLDLFACPSDNGPPQGGHCPDWVAHSERSSYDHFGNSYAANLFMIANSGGGYMRSNSPYMRPLSRVPAPSRTLLYEENIGRWAYAAREDACDFLTGIDIGPMKSIRGWHGRDWTYSRSFVDTHAEPQRIYIEGTEDADGYAHHYRSEQAFEDPDKQNYNRCIIIRGVGWQKDTMPAPPVGTGLWSSGSGRPSYEGCVQE